MPPSFDEFMWFTPISPPVPLVTLNISSAADTISTTPHFHTLGHSSDVGLLFERSMGLMADTETPDLRVSSTIPALKSQDALHDVRIAASLSLPPKKARKPTKGNEINPSPFRPHVPADRRVLLWTTPHSLKIQEAHDTEISRRLQTQIYEGVLAATVDDTRQAYGAGILRFNQFCDREGISENLRMPASSILLSAFVAEHLGTCSGKAIRNWLNGLRLWHLYNCAEWHGEDGWLPSLKRAADRQGVAFKKPPRGPITLEHLRALRAVLNLQNPRDTAIWAAATTAFWGCRRLGELLPKTGSRFTAERDLCRSARLTRSRVNNRDVISFRLSWTKTTGPLGGDCIVTATDNDVCPVWALENHFRVNHSPNSSTPMFAYRDTHTGWSTLLKHIFLTLTGAIFKGAQLENVFGHSYRIGGSLQLLLDGVAPEIIMKIGGWTSLCFLIYWRRLEQVIPLAVSRAWDAKLRAFAASQGIQHDHIIIEE